jgi:molecular chaperone DnaK
MAPDEKDVWGRWAVPGERSGGDERPFTVTDYSNTPRDSTRVPLAHRIQLKFDRFSGFIDEYVSNISPGGIFIRTDAPEDPGQLLEFEFRLGDGFELIRGRGEVVWARQRADGKDRPKGMGVRFIELSPGSKDLIYKIVDDFVAHGGKPFDLTAPAAPPLATAADAALPPPLAAPPTAGRITGSQAASLPRPSDPASGPRPSDLAARPRFDDPPPPHPNDPMAAPPRPQDLQPQPRPPGQGDAPLPWSLDLPAILPVPGVPAITPRSPLELLGPPPAGSFQPAEPGMGTPPHELAGAPAMDPLEAMLASLPPLDDLAAGAPAPGTPLPSPLDAPAPGTPPPPPPLPFSAFDLRAPRRRSHLPLIGALLAVAVLGVGVYLLRDTVLAWIDRREAPAEGPARHTAARSPAPSAPEATAAIGAPAPTPATSGAPSSAPGAPSPSGLSSSSPSPSSPAAPGTPPPAAGASPPPGSLAFGPAPRTAPAASRAVAPVPLASAASAAAAPPPASGGLATPPPLVSARPSGTPATGAGAPPAAAAASAVPSGSARLSALERITWEAAPGGGTDVVLWGNGDFTPQSYTRSRVGGVAGLPVREVVRLLGIAHSSAPARVAVATPEVSQIRTGAHPHEELHVVLDLTGAGVKVTGVDVAPHQLRLHLAGH